MLGVDPFTDWNRQHQAIFIHIPKTAGRSISMALTGERSSDHIPLGRKVATDPRFANRSFKFAIVRDPWSRFASAFESMRGSARPRPRTANGRRCAAFVRERIDPFDDLDAFASRLFDDREHRSVVLRWYLFRPQHTWVCVDGVVGLDLVGRFESREESWRTIAEKVDGAEALPEIGVSGEPRSSTDRAREFVSSAYRRDIELFGYSEP